MRLARANSLRTPTSNGLSAGWAAVDSESPDVDGATVDPVGCVKRDGPAVELAAFDIVRGCG